MFNIVAFQIIRSLFYLLLGRYELWIILMILRLDVVRGLIRKRGTKKNIPGRTSCLYFFYTTCPKCAKYYGKNYVVLVAQV